MGGGRRPSRWIRTPVGVTGLAVLLATALRLPALGEGPYPDEGGLLLVAEHWHDGGPSLYGDLFVDRPPGLLLFWKAALALGGLEAARGLALVATGVLVAAAGATGTLLAGRRGAAWSALVVAALAANPMLGSMEVDAELLGAPWTMLSVLAALAALRAPPGRRRGWLVLGSGVAAATALLVKQNLADGAVFVLVLLAGLLATRRWTGRQVLVALAAFAAGAAVPLGAALTWAVAQGPGLGVLWSSLYGFRVDAGAALVRQSSAAVDERAVRLLHLSLLSGLAVLLLVAAVPLARRLGRRDPESLAVLALVAVEVAGIVLGGSYWPHYLLGLLPGAALLAAVGAGSTVRAGVASLPRRRARMVVAVSGLVAAAAAATATAASYGPSPDPAHEHLSAWLRSARHPGDTGVVIYGHADVLAEAGLDPGYRYLWSLPVRTLDPHLDRLVARLESPRAPVWVVRWDDVHSWGLDPHDRLTGALRRDYRRVGTVCGFPVFLHRGADRTLPAQPAACRAAT